MERNIVADKTHHSIDSTPEPKSLGSLIKIDSISIDLASAMEEKNEAEKCEHFSIRGYVADMRKKDHRICLPFALDDTNKSDEQTDVLPPLHVAKFRWWHCQNCLWEIGATSEAEEIEMVTNCCRIGFKASSTCSHGQSHGGEAKTLSNVQQATKLDNFEGRTADFITYSNANTDEYCFSSCRYKKEMKAEIGHSTANIGHVNVSEDEGNREICNLTCDTTKFNPGLLPERHTDSTVALKSKGSELVESCEPNCRIHEVSTSVPATETFKCTGRSSAQQTGKLTSTDNQQINVLMACETPGIVGKIDEAMDSVKSQTTRLPSLDHELEECDNVSSESDEILAGNSLHDQHHDNLSSSIRRKIRKIRKVRLLTELLGAKENAENDQIRTGDVSSNAMPNASAGLAPLSAPQEQVLLEGNITRGYRDPKRKRMMLQEEDLKSLEKSCPNNMTKRVRVFKGDVDTTNLSSGIANSESEENASAGVILPTDTKNQWMKHKIDRNPTPGKKKKKETRIGDEYSTLVPSQELLPDKNQIKTGDEDKCGLTAGTWFPNSARDAFTGRGQQLYLDSYLSPKHTGINLSMCKKKNKIPQLENGRALLMRQSNNILGGGSIIRKGREIMQSGPEGVKLHSVHDASAKKGLVQSLNSYMAAQRTDVNYFSQIEHGIDALLPEQKGITREENYARRDVMFVGESSDPHKSGSDPFFNKGLLFDLNEGITHRTSFSREMQNCASLIEDGSSSLHKKLNISDTCNNEKTSEVQEQSEAMKKHSDQIANEVSEQGTLDDIPMDIVELMAKNQYDRLHESERNYCLSERTSNKRNVEIMVCPKVHGNKVLGSLQEEKLHMRKPVSGNARNGMIITGENVGTSKQNPVNYFSHINRNHFDMNKLEGNSAITGFRTFSVCQQKLPGGVQFPASCSIISNQNCKWSSDNVVHRSSPTNMQVLEVCNTCQKSSQWNEAEHVRSSMIPNHMPFGLNIPQNYTPQSSSLGMHSRCPDTLRKGKMIGNLDMHFLQPCATNLEKQRRNFDSDSFRRTSTKYPFVCKHSEIELNTKGLRSSDLYPNETIPAMQLLSLMDAGMQSSTPFNLDGQPKFFDKPFFPCDHHPKVRVDVTSKFLEKPFFPHDHHSKEFCVLGTGGSKGCDGSRYPSSACYGKNHPLDESCECSPAIPSVGAFPSLFQNNGNFKRAVGFTGCKSREQEKAKISFSHTQNRSRRPQKNVCRSGFSGTSHASNPVQDKQKGFLGVSDPVRIPLQCRTFEDSNNHIDLETNGVNGTIWSMKSISNTGICSVNRNPADFSIPETGNMYMITGEHLKFGNKIAAKY